MLPVPAHATNRRSAPENPPARWPARGRRSSASGRGAPASRHSRARGPDTASLRRQTGPGCVLLRKADAARTTPRKAQPDRQIISHPRRKQGAQRGSSLQFFRPSAAHEARPPHRLSCPAVDPPNPPRAGSRSKPAARCDPPARRQTADAPPTTRERNNCRDWKGCNPDEGSSPNLQARGPWPAPDEAGAKSRMPASAPVQRRSPLAPRQRATGLHDRGSQQGRSVPLPCRQLRMEGTHPTRWRHSRQRASHVFWVARGPEALAATPCLSTGLKRFFRPDEERQRREDLRSG